MQYLYNNGVCPSEGKYGQIGIIYNGVGLHAKVKGACIYPDHSYSSLCKKISKLTNVTINACEIETNKQINSELK